MTQDELKGTVKAIWKEFVAHCAFCSRTDVANERRTKDAHKNFRELGWTNTIRHGWLCGKCKSEGLTE